MRKRIKQIYLLTAVFLCAVLLAACSQKTIDDTAYIGTFLGDSGCELIIEAAEGGKYSVQLGIYRLTGLDDGAGELTAEGMAFTATDASGDPIGGIITVEGDTATVTFTASTWPYLENGSSFSYIRDDVRTDDIDDYMSNTPQTGSFSYEEVLKTYQENDRGIKMV